MIFGVEEEELFKVGGTRGLKIERFKSSVVEPHDEDVERWKHVLSWEGDVPRRSIEHVVDDVVVTEVIQHGDCKLKDTSLALELQRIVWFFCYELRRYECVTFMS